MPVVPRFCFSFKQKTSSVIIGEGSPTTLIKTKEDPMMDNNTLAHTTWECKYHIVFAQKYRRQVIYGKIKADVAQILSGLSTLF